METDATLEQLAGGKIPAIPFAKFAKTGEGPGTIPRPAGVAPTPKRAFGGLGLPDANEVRHMQRIDQVRQQIATAAKYIDTLTTKTTAILKELRVAAGGELVASRLHLDLDTAEQLIADLQGVMDKHFPPQ